MYNLLILIKPITPSYISNLIQFTSTELSQNYLLIQFYFIFSVPYDKVDQDSALVEMFGQVGAYRCKYIVAVGALAGLTVSMFGSMFPMPRIVYAMAQDGLIFR